MPDIPREILIQLISRYGTQISEEPKRCEGLLRDLCGAHKKEIVVLVAAIREGVTQELRRSNGGLPREILFERCAQRLHHNVGVVPDLARWGVESWAIALGVLEASDKSTEDAKGDVDTAKKHVTCKKCGQKFQCKSSDSGKVFRCTRCSDVVTIPENRGCDDRGLPAGEVSGSGKTLVSCRVCNATLRIKDHLLGQKIKCPKCNSLTVCGGKEYQTDVAVSGADITRGSMSASKVEIDSSGVGKSQANKPNEKQKHVLNYRFKKTFFGGDVFLVFCPHCSGEVEPDEDDFGHVINCPKCSRAFLMQSALGTILQDHRIRRSVIDSRDSTPESTSSGVSTLFKVIAYAMAAILFLPMLLLVVFFCVVAVALFIASPGVALILIGVLAYVFRSGKRR